VCADTFFVFWLLSFWHTWNCVSHICSTCTNSEPTLLHRHTVISMRWYMATTTWSVAQWTLAHQVNNNPAHSLCTVVQELLTCNGMTLVPYPLYCPNIFLFLKLKHAVQGRSFHNVRAIQEQVQAASAEFSTQMLLNASNSGEITGLTVC